MERKRVLLFVHIFAVSFNVSVILFLIFLSFSTVSMGSNTLNVRTNTVRF